jgi:phytoene synthase
MPSDLACLANSRAYCRRVTYRCAGNFLLAFHVLPRPQRRAMYTLYAFMRHTDDLADEPGEVATKRKALADWRDRLDEALRGRYTHRVHAALHTTVRRYGIPPRHLHEVIDGVECDLTPVRYATFDELYAYCYRVASAVGLACIHVWGFRDPRAAAHAEAAGVAFQLTNILRDLGEDLDAGRVYLPEEDWRRFDCPPEEWRDGRGGGAFRALMGFEVERARGFYRAAEPLADLLAPAGRAVFRVMTRTYRGLLDAIEARGYDVFAGRVRLTPWRKVRLMLEALPIRWGLG